MNPIRSMKFRSNESGAVIVLVAFLMTVIIMFVALAIDIGHLYVVRNELQNAADAGALAGARALYLDNNATSVNSGANQAGYDGAVANISEGIPVDLNWTSGSNGPDVERGHWSFSTETFTPNPSLAPVDLWGVTTAELDANLNFINAVRVTARRQDTPVASFFTRIFGIEDFLMSAQAVAYIGFAGTLMPGEADQPIVICEDSILTDGKYSCNIGRMINSGQSSNSEVTGETGGWTNFSQDNPCSGGTNANEMKDLICSGNPLPAIKLGENIGTNGGEMEVALKDLHECWENATGKTTSWNMTVPVVSCPGNNITTCQETVGAVNLNVIWITKNNDKIDDAPSSMDVTGLDGEMISWSGEGLTGLERWNSFVSTFNLKNVDGLPAPFAQSSIYFLPDCTPHDLAGLTGGKNFGILAEIPVLVD